MLGQYEQKETPERNLCCAIMLKAFADLWIREGDSARSCNGKDAFDWLRGAGLYRAANDADNPKPYSCRWICNVLGYNFSSIAKSASYYREQPRSALAVFIGRASWATKLREQEELERVSETEV